MPFDLKNLNDGTWFPYPLPNPDAPKDTNEKVCIRMPDAELMRQVDEQTTETRREFVQPRKKNGKINVRASMQHVEFQVVTNQTLRNELIWDYMIADWRLYDMTGADIPCIKENKITLMSKSSEFAIYVSDCLDVLRERETERIKEESKNSESS